MKYYLKLGFILLLITAIASGILAYMNSITAPIIAENQAKEQELARKEVLPLAKTFKEISGDFSYFEGLDDSGNKVGYTFVASLYGYSSDVKTMVGVSNEMVIEKIKIISQAETPGLGANCEKSEFQAQFSNKKVDVMAADKDGGAIKSITGATITTRTIANSIKIGLDKLVLSVSKEEVAK
ncbi:MAG: FMN-binding protein [Candidatus Cloacimonetes bacterium]|nr:FMN-binding protein [Candidatus Cloacimonadota bacterium]